MASNKPEGTALEEVQLRLDEMLERYLELLHKYETSTKELSTHMSKGFFSLAQANFSHPSRAGRFGRDYYDQRMKAIRRINFDPSSAAETPLRISIQKLSTRQESRQQRKGAQKEAVSSDGETFEPADSTEKPPLTPPASREPSEAPLSDELGKLKVDERVLGKYGAAHDEHDYDEDEDAKLPSDPLTWYGVLLPPALRAAQTQFVAGVEGSMMRAVEASLELRELEVRIRLAKEELRRLS